jgi:hypothetical protein
MDPNQRDSATTSAPAARLPGLGSRGASPVRMWGIAFSCALLLYAATADRGPQWSDSGWQQLRIVRGELHHRLGLALTHPLQFWLGRAALVLPLEPAHAITLVVSALSGAVAVANLAAAAALLTRSSAVSLIAAAAFALSHTFWQHAVHTESYALSAALMTCEWLALARYARGGGPANLVAMVCANGLGLANHMLASLTTPFVVGVLLHGAWTRRARPVALLLGVLLWLVASLPYTGLVAATALSTGDVSETLKSALVGKYGHSVWNMRIQPRDLLFSAAFMVYNLPGLTIPLALLGVWNTCRPRAHGASRAALQPRWLVWLWTAELGVFTLFALRYDIVDRYTFFFPMYALLALLSALGLAQVRRTWRPHVARVVVGCAAVTALWPPALYVGVSEHLRARGTLAALVANKPYRDGYRAYLLPWGDRGQVSRLNREALALAGRDGLIAIEDYMILFGFLYEQAVGRVPPGVLIHCLPDEQDPSRPYVGLDRLREAFRAGQPVVLVPRDRDDPSRVLPGARWERHGDLYRLVDLSPS